jgi:lysophospholipase L1-like esterase
MRLRLPAGLIARATLALFVLVVPRLAAADPLQTYVALGDSVAFGFTNSVNPSLGDRGYVGPYADSLAVNGVRPQVVNLGAYGETSSSFFTGSSDRFISASASGTSGDASSSIFGGGNSAAMLNLNYPDAATSQNSLLLSTLAAQKAAGNTISTVSVQLGANDLFAVANSPGFFSKPADQQLALIQQALGTVATNVGTVLGELRSQLPHADLIVMGYYNPYPAVPSNPFAAVAGPAIQGLNSVLQADAKALGARYVDIDTPFLGHEAQYTYIASSGSQYNVHPNALGYAIIAGEMQPVPEPSTLAVLGAGAIGLIVSGRRRRNRTAA